MKIKLKRKDKGEVYFEIGKVYFKGNIQNKIFTLNKISMDFFNYSCPEIELYSAYLKKIIDKKRLMIPSEQKLLKEKGIIYES